MAYSIDFIEKAVAYRQKGHTFKELQEAFGIPNQTYYFWKSRLESGYYDTEKPKQERYRKIDKEQLKKAVEEQPDAYLFELAALFNCTPQAVFYMLRKQNITLKKRPLPTAKNQK
jgi:transposase